MIVYLERTEIVPDAQEADFARILFNEGTLDTDKAILEQIIPCGQTQIHYCKHDERKSCTVEVI